MGYLGLDAESQQFSFTQNNPVKALKFYNKAISLFPDDESLLMARGICLEQLCGDPEQESEEMLAANCEDVILP